MGPSLIFITFYSDPTVSLLEYDVFSPIDLWTFDREERELFSIPHSVSAFSPPWLWEHSWQGRTPSVQRRQTQRRRPEKGKFSFIVYLIWKFIKIFQVFHLMHGTYSVECWFLLWDPLCMHLEEIYLMSFFDIKLSGKKIKWAIWQVFQRNQINVVHQTNHLWDLGWISRLKGRHPYKKFARLTEKSTGDDYDGCIYNYDDHFDDNDDKNDQKTYK